MPKYPSKFSNKKTIALLTTPNQITVFHKQTGKLLAKHNFIENKYKPTPSFVIIVDFVVDMSKLHLNE